MVDSRCQHRYKRRILLLSICFVLLCYSLLGSWRYIIWSPSLSAADSKKLVTLLKNPDGLVKKILANLHKHPNDDQGWYILARVYSSQGQYNKAKQAITKAISIKPLQQYKNFEKAVSNTNTSKN